MYSFYNIFVDIHFWVEVTELVFSGAELSNKKYVIVGILSGLFFDFPSSFFKREEKLPKRVLYQEIILKRASFQI